MSVVWIILNYRIEDSIRPSVFSGGFNSIFKQNHKQIGGRRYV